MIQRVLLIATIEPLEPKWRIQRVDSALPDGCGSGATLAAEEPAKVSTTRATSRHLPHRVLNQASGPVAKGGPAYLAPPATHVVGELGRPCPAFP